MPSSFGRLPNTAPPSEKPARTESFGCFSTHAEVHSTPCPDGCPGTLSSAPGEAAISKPCDTFEKEQYYATRLGEERIDERPPVLITDRHGRQTSLCSRYNEAACPGRRRPADANGGASWPTRQHQVELSRPEGVLRESAGHLPDGLRCSVGSSQYPSMLMTLKL